jgi:hypothetical protein
MSIRQFTTSSEFPQPIRNVDTAAPPAFRQELVDLIFHLAEGSNGQLSPDHCYRVIAQSCGFAASGVPYGGPRYAAGRDLNKADWKRVYDLICRFVPEFQRAGADAEYRGYVNRLLSAHGVVWELQGNGRLTRVSPPAVQTMIDSAFRELADPRFNAALAHLKDALDAYDARPRRDRDSCSNAFDALESTAKTVYAMDNATFGNVLDEAKRLCELDDSTIRVLRQLETLRHNKFGHGTTTPFDLGSSEVDFVYLTCLGAILLFARLAVRRGH